MTDLATALASSRVSLAPFDGMDVLRTTIAVTNAGDGLSDALKVDPQEFHLGDEVFVVLRCEVAKVQFVPIKDTDALSRVHVLKAGDATIIEGDLVEDHLRAQAERILRAKEEAAGVSRLQFGDDDDEADEAEVLHTHHGQGLHAEAPVTGCPDCDEAVLTNLDD